MYVLRIIVLLFLSACTPKYPWCYREMISDCRQFDSAKLKFLPPEKFTGIEVEFLKCSGGTFCYLNVFFGQIPSFPQQPEKALVIFDIDEEQISCLATKMEGGQRLLLPESAKKILTEALLKEQCVTIRLEGFFTKVTAQRFSSYFEKLQKI